MEWISVKDRLPEEGAKCFCVYIGKETNTSPIFFIATYIEINRKVEFYKQNEELDEDDAMYVSYWILIPELPQK